MCARRVLRAGLGVDTVKGPARRKRLERDLFFDPMPERVEPCLALLQSKPPAGDDWAFDVADDGTFSHGPGHPLVYRVAPDQALGFGKGEPFSHTRWDFRD